MLEKGLRARGGVACSIKGKMEESPRCSICLEIMEGANVVALPECGHKFHGDCLVPWLRGNRSCPMCRTLPQPAFGDLSDSAQDLSPHPPFSLRDIAALTRDPLRMARRRGAPVRLQQAARAFRTASLQATSARASVRAVRDSEAFRDALLEERLAVQSSETAFIRLNRRASNLANIYREIAPPEPS